MNANLDILTVLLQCAAVMQLFIALLNLKLESIMDWKTEMLRMQPLIREVHRVHSWFISIAVGIFAVMSWRFAGELAVSTSEMGRWLAALIGIFWGVRAVMQITYYSSTHWRGKAGRTAIHIALLGVYGGFAAIYLTAALH